MNKQNKILVIFILFIVFGFIIYGNVINGDFLMDDKAYIVINPYIKDFSHVKEVFSQGSLSGVGFSGNWYRPMLFLSYMIDYSLWSLSSSGYHIFNILLHIFSAIVLFLVVLKLFKAIRVAFLSGFIFLVHPVQTEAVSYVSGRADLLLVFFLLISFLSFLYITDTSSIRNKVKFLSISLASFILALLSKETAIIFPALLVIYCLTLKSKRYKIPKSELLLMSPYVGLAAIYQMFRMTILNFNNTYSSFGQGLTYHTLMFLKTLPLYWKKLIWPVNLHYHYEAQLPLEYFDLQVIVAILIIIVFIVLMSLYRVYGKLLLFGFGWFFVGMAPVSGILVPMNFVIGERWLYFSAIGIFIIVAVFINKLLDHLSQYKTKTRTTVLILLLVIYALFFIILGVRRNIIWSDGLMFAKNTLTYVPQERVSNVHSLLASEYAKRNRFKEALEEYRIAISLNPEYPLYVYNLGAVFISRDFDAKTIHEFNEIIRLSKVAPIAFNTLATKYAAIKDYNKAIKLLEKIIELDLGSWQTHYKLGNYYFLINQKEKAIISLEEALVLNPNDIDIKYNLEMLKKQK